MRADEDVLHDVLRLLARAAQQLRRIAAQRALVALDDRCERSFAAGASLGDEARVAATEQVAARHGAFTVIRGAHGSMMLYCWAARTLTVLTITGPPSIAIRTFVGPACDQAIVSIVRPV